MQSELTYHGPARMHANQLFRARLEVRPGCAISPGGRIVIAVRHVSDFGDAQMSDPEAENFIAVDCDTEGASWQLGDINDYQRHPWNRGIDLTLVAGRIEAGQTITTHLGDPGGRGPGYRCQSFSETSFRMRLGIDHDGSGAWEVTAREDSPGFEIVGAAPVRLSVVVPDATGQAGEAAVRVKPEDVYGNVAGLDAGEALLLLDDADPVGRVSLAACRPAVVRAALPRNDTWHTITAVSDDGALFARSNPFGPSPVAGYHLYWGEIHAQSGLCDGTNSPAELYAYARGAAGLDFASVTSHDFELTPRDWDEITEATREANRPGEFVTFLGYEWSGVHPKGGDNNIYFFDDEGPLVYSAPWRGAPEWDAAEGAVSGSRTLTEVIAELGGRRFMVVPHCGGRPCNFDYYDARCMPLFEIHSCHRSYEHVAHKAIRRGLRFGFIGGSDDHRGALGDSHPAARERFFSAHNGLVGVYAEELTREALWEAFFARRVYATNGARIALDMRVNGRLMGEWITLASGASLHITVWTRLDGLLDRVELVRGSETAARFVGPRNQVAEFTAEHWEGAPAGLTPYYVRVVQTDGGTAWSSPVWVEGH